MKPNWPTKNLNKSEIGRGGNAGEIFIAGRKIVGDGKISADGGSGSIGGKGGKISVISDDNQFTGKISAKGGKSLLKTLKWYEKPMGILILGVISGVIVTIFFYFL